MTDTPIRRRGFNSDGLTEWRGKQDGQVVFGTSGPADFAQAEAFRYAITYTSEGDVTLERKENGRWKPKWFVGTDGSVTNAAPCRKHLRGFGSLSPEARKEMAARGGGSVPNAKRSFSTNRELSQEAGRKGGLSRRNRLTASE